MGKPKEALGGDREKDKWGREGGNEADPELFKCANTIMILLNIKRKLLPA